MSSGAVISSANQGGTAEAFRLLQSPHLAERGGRGTFDRIDSVKNRLQIEPCIFADDADVDSLPIAESFGNLGHGEAFVFPAPVVELHLQIVTALNGLGSSVQSILLAMCLTYWITTARMVRGQIFTLREQDYALAAKVCGQTKWQILIHHLIPNSMGSIIVTMTFLIPSAIFEEAFLSFLGIGIQVPKASWGTMCNDAIQYLTQQPWLMIFPALAISITIFSLNFIGDGLRDALDPRINKQ